MRAVSSIRPGARGLSSHGAWGRSSNCQIDELIRDSGPWCTRRKTTGHYYSRLFLEALRQSRFSRPVQTRTRARPSPRTPARAYVQHTYARAYVALPRTRARPSTRMCAFERLYGHACMYTLKGGYIGFPVTTNLPRHRAIYIFGGIYCTDKKPITRDIQLFRLMYYYRRIIGGQSGRGSLHPAIFAISINAKIPLRRARRAFTARVPSLSSVPRRHFRTPFYGGRAKFLPTSTSLTVDKVKRHAFREFA